MQQQHSVTKNVSRMASFAASQVESSHRARCTRPTSLVDSPASHALGSGDSLVLGAESAIGDTPKRKAGRVRLAGLLVLLCLIWLVVLPQIGRNRAVRDYIQRNESLGIDPSAKFYTELPAMDRLTDRMREIRRGSVSIRSEENRRAR